MQLSDFDRFPNLVSMFLERVEERGDRTFLCAKRDGVWDAISWIEARRQVAMLSQALVNLGLKPGDRVMLVSENRPEWCIADLAIMGAGLVTVPTYTTNTTRDHIHILNNSGAKAVIVSTAKVARTLLPAMASTGEASHLISIDPLRHGQAGSYVTHNWDDLVQGDEARAAAALDEMMARIAPIRRSDLACIIYTSGTGGAPRGVRHHHGAIIHNVKGPSEVIDQDFGWEDEVFLSFLPLSHAYEHSNGQFLPIGLGAEIWYAESLDKLARNIEEARPTIMVTVPRLFEVLRQRTIKTIEKQGKVASFLLDRALALSKRQLDRKATILDWPMDRLLDMTLRPRARERFGGRMKALVSGGAPLNPEIGEFFNGLGLCLLQGYGQTESGPVISVNRPSAGLRMEAVGPPMVDTEVRIAEDGEILVRGELVMHGYWRNPEETAKVLVDGWLHTGDIGHFDEGGRIVITDRKKDLIVNDKGDNVSPQRVEGMLTLQPEILQAMVIGDKRPWIAGLIVPDPEWSRDWCREEGVAFDPERLGELPDYRAAIRSAVDWVNKDLSVIEKVRAFTFADEAFTVENKEMTPSHKIRRHVIKARYDERLNALYKK